MKSNSELTEIATSISEIPEIKLPIIPTLISSLRNPIIPAITKVHECKSAETGVGPSIASGSHKLEKFKIDFIAKEIKIIDSQSLETSPKSEISPANETKKTRIPKSPQRFQAIASPADLATEFRSNQFPINRKEINPIISQQSNKMKNDFAPARIQTEK